MIIGGIQKFSLLDYPGHISAIIFTQGCNFRCHFCYNPELVNKIRQSSQASYQGQPAVSRAGLFEFLEKRKGKLDGIVVTGGEPTIHRDLPGFLRRIKKMGYAVKLDTNGTNPSMLEELISAGSVDYLAMDIKAPYDKYEQTVNAGVNSEDIARSIAAVMSSELPYEFRTTVVPGLLGMEDIEAVGKTIKGADKWFLQSFKSDMALVNSGFEKKKAFSRRELNKMKRIGEKYVKQTELR